MQRSAAIAILHVGRSPGLHQQLHAEGAMVGERCVMEGSLPLVVLGSHATAALEEDVHDHVLAVVAGNVEGSAAMGVEGIWLREGGREGGGGGGREGRRTGRCGNDIHVHVHVCRSCIGQNVSCASGDCLTSRPKGRSRPRELWFSIYSCTCMHE